MTVLPTLGPDEVLAAPDAGLGTLSTERGNLPLERIDAHATITGLVARTVLTQDFHNPHNVPLEATYIFPLPARAAVTGLKMTADGRTVEAELKERAEARATYDEALAAGQRASIAEEERPDVFTLRVGNIVPGERVSVQLTLVGPLPYEDGEATYRLPLVVAPRYIPGAPLPGSSVGDGVVPDTDAVPDASRITPPILLPGFPNPVRLSIRADVDAAGLPLHGIRSSLHAIGTEQGDRLTTVAITPGERVDRDFILRLAYGEAEATTTAFTVEPGEDGEGTFELTVLPPVESVVARPRDVVLVLDRSGSMDGWKMVAARRAAARIVDTLTAKDRFAVLSFDTVVERPAGLPEGKLAEGTDRHRFRAVEHLAGLTARGGTEMLTPLREAANLLNNTDGERDRVLVLVTDGQIGDEDRILSELAGSLAGVRIHTVGIDRAVNAGFLGRLAGLGGGRCELVESEDRLDEALDRIHLRIGTPLLTGVTLSADGLTLLDDTISPARTPNAFAGVPLVLRGRYRVTAPAQDSAVAHLNGTTAAGEKWQVTVPAVQTQGAAAPVWARAHLRDLEDRYTITHGDHEALEQQIVAVSLRHHVLCRFTALVAVDSRVVAEGGPKHQVTQPVELPSGWVMPAAPTGFAAAAFAPMAINASGSAPGGAAGPALGRAFGDGPGLFSRSVKRAAQPPSFVEEQAAHGDPLTEARAQAAAEATLLRQAGTPTSAQRRLILSDLASRLDALVQQLGSEADPLRKLVTALTAVESTPLEDIDALWQQALRVLDEFAGSPTPARAPRRDFWKRS
ncbi:VIT domain-containing protein [Streptomyces sp. SID13031]|uniref:VIT domain-containing protein n=1 Tax=Streptomyces sp. SID13031 TaxID=2706046 RepID=UPI0013CC29B8|nr:VIT domain-containing protein [Streptomyces sp. SID13031]NEA34905.1 VWA domain-containing protein [Streptomyces sp. SID13031]